MLNHRQELRSRLEFSSSEEWRSYVENTVATEDRPYVLESGLTTLYLRLCEVRNIHVPQNTLALIQQASLLADPERTAQLKSLNAELFSRMSQALLALLPRAADPSKGAAAGVAIAGLIGQLEQVNESFALWCNYKRAGRKGSRLPSWEQYVRALLDGEKGGVVEFELSMATLGELLQQLRDRKHTIPPLLANRILTIHREPQGPERALAMGVVLQELLEVLTPCTFA